MKKTKEQLEFIKEWMKHFDKEDLSQYAYEQICLTIDYALKLLDEEKEI